MKNKNKLLASDSLSVLGASIGDVGILTFAYMLSNSASQTTFIISIRLLASLLVFVLLPKLNRKFNSKNLCIVLDVARSISILSIIFCTNIYQVIVITLILSFCSGFNSALRGSAYQKLLGSEERIKFISKQQSIFVTLGLTAPFVAAIIIKAFSIEVLFSIESACFLLSAIIFIFIDTWEDNKSSSTSSSYEGVRFLFKDKTQRNILTFRLFVLTTMVSYQVLSTYIITNEYKSILSAINLPFVSNYSDALAYFSFISSLALLIGNFISSNVFKIEKIKQSFTYGAGLVCSGSLIWGVSGGEYLVIYYTLGTTLIFIGLSFLRISLYTSGQELTPEKLFGEIIAASDVISRSYQSIIGVSVLSLIPVITSGSLFITLAFSSLISIPVSKKISDELRKKSIKN
ncbi:MFS transporter [Vibrio vulnificus]|uniref:MFS transporter n=1 Tax=Vibrio vulnificus TaxID=672 RepID=UPI000C7CE08C|nr:MFS transporter [Vibrio vulnificus]AUL97473.1 Unknown, probable transporter [Vibrio vulnificus]